MPIYFKEVNACNYLFPDVHSSKQGNQIPLVVVFSMFYYYNDWQLLQYLYFQQRAVEL